MMTITMRNEGDTPMAVFPNELETRIELHPGESMTIDTDRLVVEKAWVIAREGTGI